MKYEAPTVKVLITDSEEEDVICGSMLHIEDKTDDEDDPWANEPLL